MKTLILILTVGLLVSCQNDIEEKLAQMEKNMTERQIAMGELQIQLAESLKNNADHEKIGSLELEVLELKKASGLPVPNATFRCFCLEPLVAKKYAEIGEDKPAELSAAKWVYGFGSNYDESFQQAKDKCLERAHSTVPRLCREHTL